MKKKALSSISFNVSSHQLSLLLAGSLTVLGLIAFSWHNSAIQKTNLPAPSVNPSKFQKVIQPNIFFYTKSFGDLKKLFISLPYQYEGEPHLMWLSFLTQAGNVTQSWLVSHPQLVNLEWPSLQSADQFMVLYQKQPTFDSVATFLEQLPSEGIAADPNFIIDYKLPASTVSLDQSINLDQVNYILTTYRPSRYDNERYYFETTMDASKASLNEGSEIVWLLKVPTATDQKPVNIGEVHVDYRN